MATNPDKPVPMPSSVPAGLYVELSRHRIKPGMSEEADRWMQMLNDRVDECIATLDAERMAVEAIFRIRDDDGDWLYWLEISGFEGTGLDESRPIDRDHVAFSERAKIPGHVKATTEVLFMPAPVRDAVLRWAVRG
ncbi:MAG: DUF6176 family protein [Actinomycetes bacterium]